MSRLSGRLAILMILTTLLETGCENFTLIGSVNLGSNAGYYAGEADSEQDATDDSGKQKVSVACWPSGKAAFAEMRHKGFTPKKWPATELWFTKLEPVKNSLPPCPE